MRTLEKEKAQGEILHEQKLSEIKKDLAISHEKFTAAQVKMLCLAFGIWLEFLVRNWTFVDVQSELIGVCVRIFCIMNLFLICDDSFG